MRYSRGKDKRPRRMNPRSLENLKLSPPFPPGHSGNLLGPTPKRLSLTSCVRELLEAPAGTVPWARSDLTYAQTIAISIIQRAVKDSVILREVWERVDGKMTQPVELNVREEAERVAKALNLPEEAVPAIVQEAEKILGRVR